MTCGPACGRSDCSERAVRLTLRVVVGIPTRFGDRLAVIYVARALRDGGWSYGVSNWRTDGGAKAARSVPALKVAFSEVVA